MSCDMCIPETKIDDTFSEAQFPVPLYNYKVYRNYYKDNEGINEIRND